jgi:DNA repair protein RecO (recombination protein O)
MHYKSRAIVLHHLKYGDSGIILSVFTEEHGRKSYLVKGVYSKKSKFRINQLQPSFLIEIEGFHKEGNDFHQLREVQLTYPYTSIPFHPAKSTLALFLGEVLYRVIREEEKNPALFQFLFHAFQLLDLKEDGYADFHLLFLAHLTRYLGISPGREYSSSQSYFDLKKGRFVGSQGDPNLVLDGRSSELLSRVLDRDFDTGQSVLTNHQDRNQVCACLIRYFRFHIEGMPDIRSFEILKEVFA